MKKIFYFILLIIFSPGCIQKFQPNITSPTTGYLVVEGIINSGGGPAKVNLSRTTMLTDSTMAHETGSTVQVEGNDNSVYPFTEQGNGVYGTSQLILSNSQLYRLDIKTKDGKQYLSTYSTPKTTKPIDSVNWNTTRDGVQVYVNTHDPTNNSIYYKWDYVETWEFHPPYITSLSYDTLKDANGNPLFAGNQPQLYIHNNNVVNYSINTCWRNALSTDIITASSVKLSSDIIADFPVSFIPQGSDKLSVEYSILVNQYSLSADAYNFLQLMKLNTEETGSIFSTQPSQLQGNIHSVSNAAEIVIGYVSFSSMTSKRIFIYNADLTNWTVVDNSMCTQIVLKNQQDDVSTAFNSGLLPTTPVSLEFATGNVITFNAAFPPCVDCRVLGTNQKPSFWQ